MVQAKIAELVSSKYGGLSESVMAEPILFGDYRLARQPAEARLYEDVGTYDTIKPIFQDLLTDYNVSKKAMNLVFFEDALEHLTRIHRTIRLRQVKTPSCTLSDANTQQQRM